MKKLRKEKLTLVIVGLIIMSLPYFFTRDWGVVSFVKTGNIGDTIGGITAPFMSFFGSVLVYLALKSQIDANQKIKDQFESKQQDDAIDFEFNRLKERIYLVISEIDNFDIAFHEGKLISKLNEISPKEGKKYNFRGVQGLNLFLIEYF